MFDTNPKKPITSWKTAWVSVKDAAGITCRFHDLRHTTVTRLLERGVPFAVVAALMGWSPGMAMRMARRYGHIGQTVQREAMALLARKDASSGQEKNQQNPTPDAPMAPEPKMIQ